MHDQSASGATLFIEPMAVVEMNNDLRKAYSTERDEVNRILLELSSKVTPYTDDLQYNLQVLGQIDFIFAKARLSEKMNRDRTCFKTSTAVIDYKRPPSVNCRQTSCTIDRCLRAGF